MFPDMAFLQNESHYWVQLGTPRFLRHKGAASNTAFFEAHFFVRGIPLPCTIFWSVLPRLAATRNAPGVWGGSFRARRGLWRVARIVVAFVCNVWQFGAFLMGGSVGPDWPIKSVEY